jgi:PAP2 superfamily
MKRYPPVIYWIAGFLSVALGLLSDARADAVTDWNQKLIEVVLAEKANPFFQSRSAALVHAAMFEAVNSIERRYAPYRQAIDGARGASAEVAAATAAHRALLALYPKQQQALDDALERSLAGVAPSQSRDHAIALGEKAAAQLLQLRTDDRFQDATPYTAQKARGAWVPNPGTPPFGVRWGSVTPWILASPSQFRPGPPPDLASDEFKRDYLEVKELGAKSSTRRTSEQTQIANFWIGSGPMLWSQAARQLSAARGLGLADNARLFALLHMAGADSFIACFDTKYEYHNFRPITGIREGVGRDDLPIDVTWEPVIATPPFPGYVSAHGCYAGAAAVVLGSFFGDSEVPAVTLKSPTAQGLERKHTRLADIAAEASNARIWGGIHWRTDQVAGEALGRKVGEYALRRALRPAP